MILARNHCAVGARRGAENPGRLVRRARGVLFVGKHQGAGAIGGRTALEKMQGVPQHRRLLHHLDRDIRQMQMRIGILARVQAILHRHHAADVPGHIVAVDVLAHVRREKTARAGIHVRHERHPWRQCPGRIRFRLLFEAHRQHAPESTALHMTRGDDRGGTADAARGVHPQHRLAVATQRVRQIQFGHHHALEHVRRLAENQRIDIVPAAARVLECPLGRLPHQARDGHLLVLRFVLGLADPDYRYPISHAQASSTATRFCCRHGPELAWATPRLALPLMIRSAT